MSEPLVVKALQTDVAATKSGWWAALRKEGLSQFQSQGLPTRKDEDWKYTDFSVLSRLDLALAPPVATVTVEDEVKSLPSPRIVFVNGHWNQALSQLDGDFSVKLFSELSEGEGRELSHWAVGPEGRSSLESLQIGSSSDGVLVRVEDNRTSGRVLHVANIAMSQDNVTQVDAPTILFLLGRASRVTVIEVHGQKGSGVCWTTSRFSAKLSEGATLHHYRIQNTGRQSYHTGFSDIHLDQDSHYEAFSFMVGSRIGRNEQAVKLLGAEASATLNGLYIADEGQHLDNHVVVDHVSPMARSRQYFKGVLASKGRAVFNGKIIVRRDSQKSDAAQLNKNLLLGPNAEIDARPQLQIDADDVKCSHGATIGRVNAEEMFYLQSRGLSPEQAGHMLCVGFAEDLVEKIQDGRARHEVRSLLAEVFSRMKVVPQ